MAGEPSTPAGLRNRRLRQFLAEELKRKGLKCLRA